MIIDGRYKASYVGVPCGTKFLRLFMFADWAFCYEARVWRDCDQRWRDFTPFKFCDYINSFPRLSDFTDCGVKHSKYSVIKLPT